MVVVWKELAVGVTTVWMTIPRVASKHRSDNLVENKSTPLKVERGNPTNNVNVRTISSIKQQLIDD